MKLALALLLAPLSLLAQREGQVVSIGVRAGVPITDAFDTFRGDERAYFTNTKRYLIGPTIEFHLPFRLGVGVDALYKRLGYQYQQTTPSDPVVAHTVANSWEFPVLGKWEMVPGPVRPFVNAGMNIRHLSGVNQIRQTLTAVGVRPAEFNKETDIGFAFGGGLVFNLRVIRIAPEFRYTRWGGENFRDPIGALLRTNRNQGDFLLGLTF